MGVGQSIYCFEWSNGLDTALYKNIPLHNFVKTFYSSHPQVFISTFETCLSLSSSYSSVPLNYLIFADTISIHFCCNHFYQSLLTLFLAIFAAIISRSIFAATICNHIYFHNLYPYLPPQFLSIFTTTGNPVISTFASTIPVHLSSYRTKLIRFNSQDIRSI